MNNDIKIYIQRLIVVILVIYVGFLLQTAVFANLPLAGITPNILVCIVSSYGFMKGQKEGMVIGFFAGLFLDVYTGFYLGLYALCYMYIGFLNGFFKKLFYGDDLKLPMVLIASSDFVFGLLNYLILFFTRSKYDFKFYLTNIILPELIYTTLISIFIYYALLHINNQVEKLEKKGSDHFGTF